MRYRELHTEIILVHSMTELHPVLSQTIEYSLCNQSQITQTPHTKRWLWIPQSLLTLFADNNHLKPESHRLYRILHSYTKCYMNNYKNLNMIRKHLVKHNTPAPYRLVLWKTAKHKEILLKLGRNLFTNSFVISQINLNLEYQKFYGLINL